MIFYFEFPRGKCWDKYLCAINFKRNAPKGDQHGSGGSKTEKKKISNCAILGSRPMKIKIEQDCVGGCWIIIYNL